VKLSTREAAALAALADGDGPLGGADIAESVETYGVETTSYGAHQSARGLVRKELAATTYVSGRLGAEVGYELTSAGRELAKRLAEGRGQ